MIFVDQRVGSADLAGPLKRLGLPVETTLLDSADIAFEGKGRTGGSPVHIGIELKRLQDMMSSLRTGRLAGSQLPRLHAAYDYVWLVVEGHWRVNPHGQVVVHHGGYRGGWRAIPGGLPASELEKRVLTLELCGGVHVRYTNSTEDTVHFIGHLYRWFSDKALDRHGSHLAVHTPASFVPISDFRAAVSRFPGVGLRTSLGVETHFAGSLRRACTASVDEWAGVETIDQAGKARKLGTSSARKIVSFITGSRT